MTLEVTIVGEPVPWQRPRHNSRTGTFFTPRETMLYENLIAWEARSRRKQFGDRDVIVYADFYCKSKRTKDGDNMFKSVLDALQKAEVYENDRQVVEGHWRVFRGAKTARTEIRVYSVDQTTV